MIRLVEVVREIEVVMELKMARTIGWLKTPGARTGVKMATSRSRGDLTCVALKT